MMTHVVGGQSIRRELCFTHTDMTIKGMFRADRTGHRLLLRLRFGASPRVQAGGPGVDFLSARVHAVSTHVPNNPSLGITRHY